MNKNLIYKEYCTGCGLCKAYAGVNLLTDSNGFRHPDVEEFDNSQLDFCHRICMVSGRFWKDNKKIGIWGKLSKDIVYAYSTNEQVRFSSSSGGIVTTCAKFLLEEGYVDAVIQVRQDPQNVLKTYIVCNSTSEEIEKCCGSRYTISAPFDDFNHLLDAGKRYAFIGKPCDVMALRNLSNYNQDIKNSIIFYISFFCAGMPSYLAGKKLLGKLDSSTNTCQSLVYRGNGWPGYATCEDRSGKTTRMTYNESWGQILGRDIAKCCRFCLDGIGEAADISCGDGWYIKDGKPDFSEHKGRNIVLCRTKRGKKVFEEAVHSGKITIDGKCTFDDMKKIQNYQYIRRSTMIDKMNALAIMHRPVPEYDRRLLEKLEKGVTLKERLRVFIGICKRVYQRKI